MTVENRKDPYTQMLQIQQSVAKTLRKSGVGIGKILSQSFRRRRIYKLRITVLF